jgi:hypothetical protein
MGKKDILPKIGFTASANYAHSPFNSQLYGSEVIGKFSVYLPGILKHQTIKAGLNYYKQYPLSRTRPSFRYLISPPRGMEYIYGLDLIKLSVDYVFPILYPDLDIEGLLYLKRIRGSLWADYMMGKDVIILDPRAHYEDREYTSYGIELLADFHLLRIAFPVSMGGRMAYIPATQKFAFEWIYSVSIN